jgi:hypothetical protein
MTRYDGQPGAATRADGRPVRPHIAFLARPRGGVNRGYHVEWFRARNGLTSSEGAPILEDRMGGRLALHAQQRRGVEVTVTVPARGPYALGVSPAWRRRLRAWRSSAIRVES